MGRSMSLGPCHAGAGGERPRSHWAGFTLIELLVVIAIIATLALLMMPSMETVMERYREAACQSNLHELTIAAFSYTGDKGKLPRDVEWVPGNYDWTVWSATNGTLYPYVKETKSYLCPTFYLIVRDLPVSVMGGPTTARSYSMSYYTRSNPTLSGLREPATKFFFAEENPTGPTYVNGVAMSCCGLNDGVLLGIIGGDCPGTFHRFASCMTSYFDGHTGRFIMMDTTWPAHFKGE